MGGSILIRADNIALEMSSPRFPQLDARGDQAGGTITLVSRGGLDIQNSRPATDSGAGIGGTVDLRAGTEIDLTGTSIGASGLFGTGTGGTITMAAPVISIRGSGLAAIGNLRGGTVLINGGAQFTSQQSAITAETSFGNGGTIQIGANKVALTDSQLRTLVFSSGGPGNPTTVGGHITVNAKDLTLTNSQLLSTAPDGQGGTIHIEANKVGLTDSQLNTSVTGGPQSVGGTITVDVNKATFNNSQVLSTATEGHGGTIGITTHKLNSINSVIDATSQSGTNGTVTIQHP